MLLTAGDTFLKRREAMFQFGICMQVNAAAELWRKNNKKVVQAVLSALLTLSKVTEKE